MGGSRTAQQCVGVFLRAQLGKSILEKRCRFLEGSSYSSLNRTEELDISNRLALQGACGRAQWKLELSDVTIAVNYELMTNHGGSWFPPKEKPLRCYRGAIISGTMET